MNEKFFYVNTSETIQIQSPNRNYVVGKPLITANGLDRMISARLIAKIQADTTKYLGFFDWLSY